jgi:hypothetical protein
MASHTTWTHSPMGLVMPPITCARCSKHVDRCEVAEDLYLDSFHVKVWCHGETDKCTVTRELFSEMLLSPTKLVTAIAFATPAIPALPLA